MSSVQHDITVYTTEHCVYCHVQKDFLQEHNISFREVRVDSDTEAAEEMITRSGQMGVPFTIITNQAAETEDEIVGFDRLRLTKVLGI
ncbi:MAG TPA: glutaredoxin domain-containing protein [Candidatus Saccharimonadia bacterium]